MDKTISTAKQKINFIFTALLALSVSFGQFTRISLNGFPEFYIHDVVLVSILIINFNYLFEKSDLAKYTKLLSLSLLTSFLLNNGFESPLNYLYSLRLIAYLLGFSVLPKIISRNNIKNLLIISAAIFSIIGITQFLLLPDLRIFYYLGWDDHLYRLTFPYFDPTFAGSMLSLALLYSLDIKYYLLTYLTVPLVLLTYARSIFISITVTAITTIKKHKKIVIIGVIIGILLLPRRFGEGNNLLRTFSIFSRLDHDAQVYQLFKSKPLFGVGMNNIPSYLVGDSDFINRSTTANNSLIFLLSTSGIVGTFIMLLLLKAIIKSSSHKSSWTFVFIASMFNNVIFYPFVMIWLILLEANSRSSKL